MSERRGMKGFVLLAALLLVPSAAYFQKLRFEGELQAKLRTGIRSDLEAAGVQDAEVTMDWLDVTMSGVAPSEDLRKLLPIKTTGRPGVRLAAGGNKLRVPGWVRVERLGREWKAEGLLPETFLLRRRTGSAEEWGAAVRREKWVEPPIDAREWEEFLLDYFEGPGDRWVELRGGKLAIGGEATRGLRADWLSMASSVVPKEHVRGEFSIHRSVRHFAGYLPEQVADLAALRTLRAKLAAGVVGFDPDAVTVAAEETRKVTDLAAAILEAESGMVFRLEGSPAEEEEGTGEPLGLRRAKEVGKLLIEYGVKPERIVTVAVNAREDGKMVHQVEVLVD